MRKKALFCFLLVALFIFSTIGTSFAAYKVVSESVHEIDLAGVKARIIEQYEPPADVCPGSIVDKVVNVKNTGSSDCIVRVQVEKAWGETRSEDGKLIVDSSYSTENIVIEYNTEYWLYDAEDGYFYYKGILKPGETTAAPLFREFSITTATGNSYKGLEADILVKMECIQAGADAITVWNKSFAELGIVYTFDDTAAASAGEISTVSFIDEEEEFSFNPETTDLFRNFKNLVPGETRSQIIEVENISDTNRVEIFLRADNIDQSAANAETLELVNRLLREYATIVVTDEAGTVIYNGPIWGALDSNESNPESMKQDISLGEFQSGEKKRLDIQLQLDSSIGNEYQNLFGLIKWVWSAQEITNPNSSDETVEINGSKTWKHGSNPVENRPQELIIYVKANGNVILTETVTAEDHWSWSFLLPKYDSNGEVIEYTIDEAPIPGYETTIHGNDVTNTHESYEEVDISGSKTWIHGSNTSSRPDSIVVHVKNGDEIIASRRVTAAEDWKWSFSLPKYDVDGKEITYTMGEEEVAKYTLSSIDGYNLTNKYVNGSYPGDNARNARNSVRTGDTSSLWKWAALTAASAIALIGIMARKKKTEEGGPT